MEAMHLTIAANETNKAKYNFEIAMLDVVPIVSFTHVRFFSSS
jgi:hypothetical protein